MKLNPEKMEVLLLGGRSEPETGIPPVPDGAALPLMEHMLWEQLTIYLTVFCFTSNSYTADFKSFCFILPLNLSLLPIYC